MPASLISADRLKRLEKLNKLMVQGGYTNAELVAKFGISPAQLNNDKKWIQKNWWAREQNSTTLKKRRQRILELEQVKRLALESYFRSRKDKQEVTSTYHKQECEDCAGTGRLKIIRCPVCEGQGFIEEEKVTTKVVGQAGDSSFLNVAKACVIEMCKLDGLHKPPEEKIRHVVQGTIGHFHKHKYDDVDPELVLQAKGAIAALETAKRQVAKPEDKHTVDAEFVCKKEEDQATDTQ